jgi:hypothetical protein
MGKIAISELKLDPENVRAHNERNIEATSARSSASDSKNRLGGPPRRGRGRQTAR